MNNKPIHSRRILLSAAVSPMLACCIPAARAAIAAPVPQVDVPNHLPTYLQGLQLRDQHGRPWDAGRLQGHLTLMQFVFTQCSSVCPAQTRALVALREGLPAALRPRLHLLSISLDALGDTPATLLRYAQRMGADQHGWHWLTGKPSDIGRLSDALALFPPRPRPDQATEQARRSAFRQQVQPAQNVRLEDHTTALWLLDDRGAVRQRYAGQPVDVARLSREIAALDALLRAGIASR